MVKGVRDELGTRMKHRYESRAQTWLPRRTYTIIRLDGKAFHTYTRHLERPFDTRFMADMTTTTALLCKEIDGAVFGYTQSDEISLLLTDFASVHTEAWFDGNVQKLVSVSASMAAAAFTKLRPDAGMAVFDARAFTIPDRAEVANYFIWRQHDATRNSISSAAQAQFSHRQLHGLSGAQLQALLFAERGINWNDYPTAFKRGQLVAQTTVRGPVTWYDRAGEPHSTDEVERHVWEPVDTPVFTQSPWLADIIPRSG